MPRITDEDIEPADLIQCSNCDEQHVEGRTTGGVREDGEWYCPWCVENVELGLAVQTE